MGRSRRWRRSSLPPSTHESWTTFLAGLASGVMTAVGGLGHALPYLIPHFWTATLIAFAVVFVGLWAIARLQNRFMEALFLRSVTQVVLGGALVLAAGILVGGG